MALRWTMSKDGKLRADMRIEVRVLKDTWDWMRAHSTWSDAKILAWWREAILEHSPGRFTIVAYPSGELDVITWDEALDDQRSGEPSGNAYCDELY